jgi:hypothetical protein
MTYATQSISLRIRGTTRRDLLTDLVERLNRKANTRITRLDFSVGVTDSSGELAIRTTEPLGTLLERARGVEGVTSVAPV